MSDSKRQNVNLHPSTTQLGGKGTVRRRRYRKTTNLSETQISESMKHFLVKNEFQDYGTMEKISFINDNGDITSYDSVRLLANLKNGFYNFTFNTQAKPKRSSKTEIPKNNNNKIEKASELFHTLDFIKQQSTISDLDYETRERMRIITNEIHELVGSDAYEYLSRYASKRSELKSSNHNLNVLFQDDEDEISEVADFEEVSNKKDEEKIEPIEIKSELVDSTLLDVEKKILVEKTEISKPSKKSKKKKKKPEIKLEEPEKKSKNNKKVKEEIKTRSKSSSISSSNSGKKINPIVSSIVEEIPVHLPPMSSDSSVKKDNPIKNKKDLDDVKELRKMAFLMSKPQPKKKKKNNAQIKNRKNDNKKENSSNLSPDNNSQKISIISKPMKFDSSSTKSNSVEETTENKLNTISSTDETSKSADKTKKKRQSRKKIESNKQMETNNNQNSTDELSSKINQSNDIKINTNKSKNKKKKKKKNRVETPTTGGETSLSKQETDDVDKNIISKKMSDSEIIASKSSDLLNVENDFNDKDKSDKEKYDNKIEEKNNLDNQECSEKIVLETKQSETRCDQIMENLDKIKEEIEKLTLDVANRDSVSSIELVTPSSDLMKEFSITSTEWSPENDKTINDIINQINSMPQLEENLVNEEAKEEEITNEIHAEEPKELSEEESIVVKEVVQTLETKPDEISLVKEEAKLESVVPEQASVEQQDQSSIDKFINIIDSFIKAEPSPREEEVVTEQVVSEEQQVESSDKFNKLVDSFIVDTTADSSLNESLTKDSVEAEVSAPVEEPKELSEDETILNIKPVYKTKPDVHLKESLFFETNKVNITFDKEENTHKHKDPLRKNTSDKQYIKVEHVQENILSKLPVQNILIEENLKIKTEMYYEKKFYFTNSVDTPIQSTMNSMSTSNLIDIYNYNTINNYENASFYTDQIDRSQNQNLSVILSNAEKTKTNTDDDDDNKNIVSKSDEFLKETAKELVKSIIDNAKLSKLLLENNEMDDKQLTENQYRKNLNLLANDLKEEEKSANNIAELNDSIDAIKSNNKKERTNSLITSSKSAENIIENLIRNDDQYLSSSDDLNDKQTESVILEFEKGYFEDIKLNNNYQSVIQIVSEIQNGSNKEQMSNVKINEKKENKHEETCNKDEKDENNEETNLNKQLKQIENITHESLNDYLILNQKNEKEFLKDEEVSEIDEENFEPILCSSLKENSKLKRQKNQKESSDKFNKLVDSFIVDTTADSSLNESLTKDSVEAEVSAPDEEPKELSEEESIVVKEVDQKLETKPDEISLVKEEAKLESVVSEQASVEQQDKSSIIVEQPKESPYVIDFYPYSIDFKNPLDRSIPNFNQPQFQQFNDVEIPIYIAPTVSNTFGSNFSTTKSLDKLNIISSKLNINLDSLTNRDEHLFKIEEKVISNPFFEPESNDFKSKITYFNKIFSDNSKTSSTNPFCDKSQVFDQFFTEKSSVSFNESNNENDTFQLIKISIVNKRPVSSDNDDALNETDEEQYLDQSFGTHDDVLISENKLISSLDPSLSNEYDLTSLNHGSVYSRERSYYSNSESHQRIQKDTKFMDKSKNPFFQEPIRFVHRGFDDFSKVPSTNPFREDNFLLEQPLNVQSLSVQNQTSIQSEFNRFPVKISVDSNNDLNISDNSQIKSIKVENFTEIKLTDDFKSRSDEKSKENRPKFVKTITHSEEDLLFRKNLDEIKQEIDQNLRRSREIEKPIEMTKITEEKPKSKIDKSETKKENGILSMFTRFFNVIRSPFTKNSDSKKKPKQKEYKQSLISSQEDEDDDEKDIKIFTISDAKNSHSKLPWDKSKETKIKYATSKDITPKEVAKMRKSKSQTNGKGSGWKCCLF
ncbi:unnamed protein product [Brachionus calyciflorus]|uniref:Uncharacterized protein n=1 Tax=Brachionus calyciflorus TaxID=104777 RepID=A0A813MWS6_9BILA|nr:unnamed protein product [Brachionus calyciflorus]